jgi:hypothetical protein
LAQNLLAKKDSHRSVLPSQSHLLSAQTNTTQRLPLIPSLSNFWIISEESSESVVSDIEEGSSFTISALKLTESFYVG